MKVVWAGLEQGCRISSIKVQASFASINDDSGGAYQDKRDPRYRVSKKTVIEMIGVFGTYLSPGVFEVVCIDHRDVANIAGLKIERVRSRGRFVHSQTTLSRQNEIPLVARGVPVKLSHRTRLDGEQRSCKVGCDREC